MIADGDILACEKLLESNLETFYSTLQTMTRFHQERAKAMEEAYNKK